MSQKWFCHSGSQTLFFGGREATTGNASAVCRLVVNQRAKKVVSDSPGLVGFAIRLVNSVLNLPEVQVMFSEEFE